MHTTMFSILATCVSYIHTSYANVCPTFYTDKYISDAHIFLKLVYACGINDMIMWTLYPMCLCI